MIPHTKNFVYQERGTTVIDINTKFITLIGTPLTQSFAARMQNAGYAAGHINLCYFYTETDDAHLGEIINGIRYMPSFAGCAITKPNKVKVLQYLDELDPFCEKMGACNTILRTDDCRLKGYNTDGSGFLISIRDEAGIDVEQNTFFCFGAGGAGRAMCSALAYSRAKKIYVTDPVADSAMRLAEDINTGFAPIAEYVPFGDYTKIQSSTVVMNASGIGMGKTIGQSPMPEEYIREGQFYFDACYNPDKTQFLRNAEKRGCRILNGLGMSLYQGAAQIRIWTGQDAPIDAMRQELLSILAEQQERERR